MRAVFETGTSSMLGLTKNGYEITVIKSITEVMSEINAYGSVLPVTGRKRCQYALSDQILLKRGAFKNELLNIPEQIKYHSDFASKVIRQCHLSKTSVCHIFALGNCKHSSYLATLLCGSLLKLIKQDRRVQPLCARQSIN